MPNFAIHDGSTVLNVIVADNLETAESITGFSAIEIVNNKPCIDWIFDNNEWKSKPPFPSWTWNGENWNSPIPMPSGGQWIWDETEQAWIEAVTE